MTAWFASLALCCPLCSHSPAPSPCTADGVPATQGRCGRVAFLGWGQHRSEPSRLHSSAAGAMQEGSHAGGQQMSPRGPGARGSSGKGQGSQQQWSDGLYSPGTTWDVVGVGLPHSSFHILGWHSQSTCLCTPIPSDRGHDLMESDLIKSPLPILSFSLYICLSKVPHAAPCGTCMPVCTEGGRNNAQQSKSFPISWFFQPSLSPYSHPLSQGTAHSTAAA